jgi:hypothetical protein
MCSSLARRLVVGGLLFLSAAVLASPQGASRQDADRFQQKIQAIERRGAHALGPVVRTTVTESEVNAYLALSSGWFMPSGVIGPRVSILGGDQVSGRAIVDLDAVRRAQKAGWLNPLSYLGGRVLVTARGVVRARVGVVRFELDAAEIGGVPIPNFVLQQIVSYYTRSEAYPNGISLDDPFPLPSGIRAIEQSRGQAVVVQ